VQEGLILKNKKFVVLILMLVLVAVQPVNAEELEHDFDFGLETVRASGE